MTFLTLVVLPCHSIWKAGPTNGEAREEWTLASFQITGNDHKSFIDHVADAVSILEQDSASFLVISGGQTKCECGPVSELLTYFQLAKAMFPQGLHLFDRITTEEFARDSFENVLFLICRFYEVHGYYPKRVCIVGFEFKRKRFVDLHLIEALRFRPENVEYRGNTPDPCTLDQMEKESYFKDLRSSEYTHAYAPFSHDLYGVKSPLSDKRRSRNPFNRHHGYAQSNPELREYLSLITLDDDDAPNSTLESILLDEILKSLPHSMPWM